MDYRVWLLLACGLVGCSAQDNIGCLFNPGLCTYPQQWCYDDYVFGRCLPNILDLVEEDFYQFNLGQEAIALLKHEIKHLYKWNYLWSHPYTQCVLKAVLGAMRFRTLYERGVCRPWADLGVEEMDPHFGPLMMNSNIEPVMVDPNSGPIVMDPNRGPVLLDPNIGPVMLNPNGIVIEPDRRPYIRDPNEDFYGMDLNRIPFLDDPNRRAFLEDPHVVAKMMGATRDFVTRDEDAGSIRLEPNGKTFKVDPSMGVIKLNPHREPLMMDPKDVAIVKFTPSEGDKHSDFADEVYSPAQRDDRDEDPPVYGVEEDMERNEVSDHDYNYLSKKSEGPMRRSPLMHHLLPPSGIFTPLYNTPDKFRVGLETKDTQLLAKQQPSLSENIFQEYNTPKMFREGFEVKDIDAMEQTLKNNDAAQEAPLTQVNEAPGKSRQDMHTKVTGDEESEEAALERMLKAERGNEIPTSPVDRHTLEKGSTAQVSSYNQRLSPKLERLAGLLYAPHSSEGRMGAGYTEGGLVKLPQDEVVGSDMDLDDGLDDLMSGFKRPERLDVKKPGPLFTAINLAEQRKLALLNAGKGGEERAKHDLFAAPPPEGELEALHGVHPVAADSKDLDPPQVTKPSSDTGQYDVVDTTYAYIGFKNSVASWQEGRKIVRTVAQLLGLPPTALSDERVDRNEVTFKVLPNSHGVNASEVARRMEAIKAELRARTGVEVTSAGIGDKTKLPTVLSLGPDTDHELYIAILLCGVIGSLIVAATALFVIRRHSKSRQKLQNLTAPDTEASKDYQELCRARMATKAAQEKPEPIGNRIASLSRESEGSNNSPSSRSSTSSWSEEPALTNMDISTGHMVLSYMEDHLKNKDRLDQEWVALCAYEAEPCATTHAQKPDNVKKNRYNDIVPFDHSRVVLNDLANISGSDYINASTITDHDPRNPAYIATQGPLPHTAADFWQLVWEQGSVVMVMLTRLTENGNAMCHRYWPEEGSELYHIYEVHLVSEHIWCDDYLVRSFYLKNLKTGETRTVTQFHFLSWPDNGIPLSTKALLEFRRKVNKSYRGRSCPIVVHCSDGAGRTGTYCVIDMVLNRMAKGAKEIDIAATLEHIRDQRASMVKTKVQFEFVLTAVAEEVNAILKALPTQQAPATVPAPPQ